MNQSSTQYMNRLDSLTTRAPAIFYKYLWNRNHRYRQNTAKVNCGDTGCGKTVNAVVEAYTINKKFNESHYCNTAKEFIDAVDSSKRGDCIIWDEAGVSLSSRKWHSLSNILTGEVLQTYRINYLTVFFITPDLSFIDVQARKLMTIFCETKRYDHTQAYNYLYNLSVDRKRGDIFFPWYKFRAKGQYIHMPRILMPFKTIKKVPKPIWDGIRKKEMSFKEKVRKRSLALIRLIEQEEEGDRTIFDYINEVDSNRLKFTNNKGKLDIFLMQTHLQIGRDKARQIQRFIQKKDVDEQKTTDGGE